MKVITLDDIDRRVKEVVAEMDKHHKKAAYHMGRYGDLAQEMGHLFAAHHTLRAGNDDDARMEANKVQREGRTDAARNDSWRPPKGGES